MWKRFLYPPAWLIVLLAVVSTAALIAVFAAGWEQTPVAYAVYAVSFYALSVACVALVPLLPRGFRHAKKKVTDTKFGGRYFSDVAFKAHVSLYVSLGINLLYAAVNAVSAVLYRTAWFAIFAVYYGILAVMRFLLLRYMRKNEVGARRIAEYRRSRLCAVILMTVNITLSGAVLMMVSQDRGFDYAGILIYVMAAYTFYITAHACVGLVKYRKYNSPVMLMSKIISLAAALVSMLSLETAMLGQFGGDTSPAFRRIMIAATGAGVCAVVLGLSLYAIVHATAEIRKARRTDHGE